jgi:hypothetical protein
MGWKPRFRIGRASRRFIAQAIAGALITLPIVSAAADVWSGYTEITRVYPTPTQLIFNTTYSNPKSTCEGGTRWRLDSSYPDYSTQVAGLLAAFMAGKQVRIVFQDTQAVQCSPIVNRYVIAR